MKPIPVNPEAIRADVARGKIAVNQPRASFGDVIGDVMGGIAAMGPAGAEFISQSTGGNVNAAAVFNAAFSGMEAAGGATGTSAGFSPYSTSPGVFSTPRYTTQTGTVDGRLGLQSSGNPDDPSQYQYELMQTMNANNLKLLELQALMQSNMQSWTTKSNILSADHRSRMSMIEKFTARA